MVRIDDDKTQKLFLDELHDEYGARFQSFAGFSMPVQYEGIKSEHLAVRNAVGLFDVSHMGEIIIAGKDAVAVANQLMTNDISSKSNGKALYTVLCNEKGGIVEDCVVYRLGDQKVMICANAANRQKVKAFCRDNKPSTLTADIRDQSDDYIQLALQGPQAESLLSRIIEPKVKEIGRFALRPFGFRGKKVIVSRTGYTGEDGFELYLAPGSEAKTLFNRLVERGRRDFELQLCGLGARDTLRIEAMLHLYGRDIDETTDPFEAGLGWTVKDKDNEYVGMKALQTLRDQESERVFRSFKLQGRGMLRGDYPILKEGKRIGVITSGGWSPLFETSVGLGYIDAGEAEAESVDIEIHSRDVPADVIDGPVYER